MVTTLKSNSQIANAEFLLPAVGYSGQTEIELQSIPISILPNGQLTIDSPIDAETMRTVSIFASYLLCLRIYRRFTCLNPDFRPWSY